MAALRDCGRARAGDVSVAWRGRERLGHGRGKNGEAAENIRPQPWASLFSRAHDKPHSALRAEKVGPVRRGSGSARSFVVRRGMGITGRPEKPGIGPRGSTEGQADYHSGRDFRGQRQKQLARAETSLVQIGAKCNSAAAVAAAVAVAACLVVAPVCLAEPLKLTGASQAQIGALFERSCAGCHAGGGNLLKPGYGLTKEELSRNNALSADELFRITYSGVGRMPGFGENCAPRAQCTFGPRLADDVIAQLADFVLQNAETGWTGSP